MANLNQAIKWLNEGKKNLMDNFEPEMPDMPEPLKESISSVKVTKNSKGYNWEIKVYDKNPQAAFDETIRLENECNKKWGVAF